MSDVRKLAAIMFTDIAGYTAMMGADEQQALRVLAQSRTLVQQLIPRFHGTLIENFGDETLCSFESAVEAVHCARAIQESLRNDPSLHLRIGIHIGDVLFSADQVIGDGVNVASRIHALAEPGGICVSEQVYDAIRNQPGIQARLLGERHLKNVNRAIKVYALSGAQPAVSSERVSPLPLEAQPFFEGERRQLTLVCCRLTVTNLDGDALDPEGVDQLLHAQHATWADLAARGEGQVASVMGDRVLLVFGHPQAHEDDARRAVRAALQIATDVEQASGRLQVERHIRLDVRIGVHTGLVIVRESSREALGNIVGRTPQIAADLVELASPGEVLVSIDTQRLLRGDMRTEPAGALDVSAPSERLPVFRLTRLQPSVAPQDTVPPIPETPLVGRDRQLDELLATWARTKTGQAGAVFIRGEPGIGKSRLVRELRRHVPVSAWLECHCVADNQDSPLRPVIDLLLAMDRSIESLLTRVGLDLAENAPLFAALLSLPLDDRYQAPQLSPERQKELTLHALVHLLFRRAAQQPLVFTIENLHWADPTTLELVDLLIQEVRTAKVLGTQPASGLCLLFTARPEFDPPWSTDGVSIIGLAPLGRGEVEEMITAGLAGGRPVPPAVVEAIVERADGIPLFVEEVARVLLESDVFFEQGDRLTAGSLPLEIPSSLRDLLTARLDNLPPSAKETAQLAALLGREFRHEVLQAVSQKDNWVLRDDLANLTAAHLVFQRRRVRSESYVFKHALVRETAYDSMMRLTRQALHLRVANVLRQRFPDVVEHRPEILALHFERGGEVATAVEYWYRAGDSARKRAAYVEAIHQLERGLGLLQTVQESSERMRQKVELLTTLGTALFSTRGYAAEEVQRPFAQAWELCEQLGDDIPLKVLWGIWAARISSGDREGVDKLVPRFRRVAARAEDPVSVVAAHACLGTNAFWRGNLVEAQEHLLQARQLYGTDAVGRFAVEYGYDPGLYAYAFGTLTLWQLGYPDQAEALRREMLALAERSRNPYSVSLALGFGVTVLHDRGETESVLDMADRLIALATEHRLYFWLAPANCCRGAALVQRGDTEAGLAQIRQGLDLYKAIGVLSSYCYFLIYSAQAYLDAGRANDGLAVVDESLSLCQTLLARFHEPELLRLRGELLLLLEDWSAAETSLRRALEAARLQHGRSYELRATISLSRLLRTQGRRDEGRRLLSDVYAWFTEGFDTRDLRIAKALLAELS